MSFTPPVVRAPRGTTLHCKNWVTEAAYRMLQNNLDPEVAENPAELVVYGGIGKAARNWPSFFSILESLKNLNEDETLLVKAENRLAFYALTPMRRACSLPILIWFPSGPPGNTSASSIAKAL